MDLLETYAGVSEASKAPDVTTCYVKDSLSHILGSRYLQVAAELLCHFENGSWALILLRCRHSGCGLARQSAPALTQQVCRICFSTNNAVGYTIQLSQQGPAQDAAASFDYTAGLCSHVQAAKAGQLSNTAQQHSSHEHITITQAA